MRWLLLGAPLFGAALFLSACGGDDSSEGNEPKSCSVADQTGCKAGEACEEVEGGDPACFAPLTIHGKVVGALDQKPVEGAHVVARDANDAAVSTVAVSAADGTYDLHVPAKRDAKGNVLSANVTLRADASGFQTFPEAPRVALPVDLADAAGSPPVLASAATDIALIPLPDAKGLGSISGKVVADHPGGTLVVAGGATGLADAAGSYTVFNVPAGQGIEVHGYASGLQLAPAKADVTAGKDTAGVDLKSTGEATARVSGKINIVDSGGASSTSIVLAVEDTFNETAARGEVPKGLRAGNVSGDFAIDDVPDGKYVVLAAFENDGLVRDPDTGIGGTAILHITVAGKDVALSDPFKVTGALDVVSPGAKAMETVSGTPSFSFAKDPSADHYEVRIFDALGNQVWEDTQVPPSSGSKPVVVAYGGPALTSGMIYQFRAVSIGKDGVPISMTEDLKGVFLYK